MNVWLIRQFWFVFFFFFIPSQWFSSHFFWVWVFVHMRLFWVCAILISFIAGGLCLVNRGSHAKFSEHKFPWFSVLVHNWKSIISSF